MRGNEIIWAWAHLINIVTVWKVIALKPALRIPLDVKCHAKGVIYVLCKGCFQVLPISTKCFVYNRPAWWPCACKKLFRFCNKKYTKPVHGIFFKRHTTYPTNRCIKAAPCWCVYQPTRVWDVCIGFSAFSSHLDTQCIYFYFITLSLVIPI